MADEIDLKTQETAKKLFGGGVKMDPPYRTWKAFDRELFVSVLNKVLQTPADTVPELTLLNTVARHKAEALLGKTDEYF